MSNLKIFSVVAGLLLVLAVVPFFVKGQTAAELEAQIQQLLAQLQALQNQLNQAQGGGQGGNVPAVCSGVTFSRNLSVGSRGADVKCLQAILNQSSDTQVATSGAGSPGNETTYFGPKTKTAVAKFQQKYASEILAPLGLTKGTGFVGASTRAKLNSILTSGQIGEEEEEEEQTSPPPTPPTSQELSVQLAADNPPATTIISDGGTNVAGSQALIDALKLKFTAPSGKTVKVNSLVLKRIGVSVDSDIDNVYLYDGNTKVAEMASLSLGTVTFSGSPLFEIRGQKVITVKFDLNKDTGSGKTIGFKLDSANDVTTDSGVVKGTFPISGNLMTTAVVSDFGKLSVVKQTNASTVDPGTTGFEAMKVNVTAANQNIKLYKVKFLMLGSIGSDDIRNLKLYDGGTELASVEKLATDKTVTFDLSASPLTILSGVTKTLSLRVDVIGGATRTIQFSIQRATDIEAMDANYNVWIKADSGTVGTYSIQTSDATTVNAGNLVVSLATDSPSGNVPLNGTNIVLAKYNLQAVGEPIKISELTVQVSSDNFGGVTHWTNIRNVKLYYDGAQIGTTQTSVAEDAAVTIAVNFTVPVGTTKTLEIRADIASASGASDPIANNDVIKARLNAGSNNAQRVVSLGTFNVPGSALAGNQVTVSAAALSAAKNASVGNFTLVKGATNQRIASFLLTAGASEGVDVSSITFEDGTTGGGAGSQALGAAFTNLKLMAGTTQLGSTRVTSTSDAATTQYTFYPSPALSIPAGTTVQIDLYADILSNATWASGEVVLLASATGTGKITNQSANISSSTAGQAIELTTAGTLSVAVDTSTPVPMQVVGGATDQVLGIWKFSANTVEDLVLTQLRVENQNGAGSPNVRNLKLFVGSTQVGSTVPALDGSNRAWFRNLNISIPRGGNTVVTLKGDITPYAEGLSVGNHVVFKVETPASITGATGDTIIARGATSGQYANLASPSTPYSANAVYPYRTTLAAALSTTKPASGNVRSGSDTLGRLTLTGTSAADAQFRPGNEANDEGTTNWVAIDADGNPATDNTKIDGTFSIKSVSATNHDSALAYDFNAGVPANYSRASLWLRPTVSGGSSTYSFVVCSDHTLNTCQQTTSLSVTDSAWNFVDVALSGLTSASRYVGVKATAAGAGNTVTMLIDVLVLYNDSMVVQVSGDLNSSAPVGTPFLLKYGGSTVAVGYYTGTSASGTVTLIPTTLISVGASSLTLDLVTSTTALMKADTTATEVLSLRMDMGTVTSGSTPSVTAGDFRWYDQAVSATSPITWINPSGGYTDISIGY
jgi:hypothetical protein